MHIEVMLDLITVGVARLEELQFAESSHALEVKRTDALRHTGRAPYGTRWLDHNNADFKLQPWLKMMRRRQTVQ